MSDANRFSLRQWMGIGALAATLALSFPSALVVQAETADVEALTSETEHGGLVCDGNPDKVTGPSLNQALGEAAIGVHSTSASDPRGEISLNHRGYNYGPPPTGPDQAVLMHEARRSK